MFWNINNDPNRKVVYRDDSNHRHEVIHDPHVQHMEVCVVCWAHCYESYYGPAFFVGFDNICSAECLEEYLEEHQEVH